MEDYVYPLILFIIWIISYLAKKKQPRKQPEEQEIQTTSPTKQESPLETFLKKMFQETEEGKPETKEPEIFTIQEESDEESLNLRSEDAFGIKQSEEIFKEVKPEIRKEKRRLITPDSFKKAIIWKELLGAPVSMKFIKYPFLRRH